jgi:DNA adenine methylase
MLKWQLAGRAEFDRLLAVDPETLTDLERAARFLYLQRLAFGGKVAGRSFGVDTTGPARFDTTKLGATLEAIHERLAGVTIECLDWRDFLARWNRPHALFYIDPPYLGAERYYGAGLFPASDHRDLAAVLKRLKGRFVLTMNDTPEARAIYGGFKVETAALSYALAGAGRSKRVREIIVTG